MGMSVAAAALGIFAAWTKYLKKPFVATEARGLTAFAAGAFFVDEFYRKVLIDPLIAISRGFLFRFVDVVLIDGTINGIARVTSAIGGLVRYLQTGSVRTYLYYLGGGAAFLMVVIFMGRW
jgi:NADH-quinone oxidoreductase subunit L